MKRNRVRFADRRFGTVGAKTLIANTIGTLKKTKMKERKINESFDRQTY